MIQDDNSSFGRENLGNLEKCACERSSVQNKISTKKVLDAYNSDPSLWGESKDSPEGVYNLSRNRILKYLETREFIAPTLFYHTVNYIISEEVEKLELGDDIRHHLVHRFTELLVEKKKEIIGNESENIAQAFQFFEDGSMNYLEAFRQAKVTGPVLDSLE